MILDERELTAAERVAIADEARPGVWVGDKGSDGRPLDQEQTDRLVARELATTFGASHVNWSLLRAVAPSIGAAHVVGAVAFQQRGGLHSDPLVRLLAFRAWGDRDRRWRKRDTARALYRADTDPGDSLTRIYGFDGLAIYDESWNKRVGWQATRGTETVWVDVPQGRLIEGKLLDLMLDVCDELDSKLAAKAGNIRDRESGELANNEVVSTGTVDGSR